ncbi:exo 1,3/1,4-beta-D-glucan glucohydrolase [Pseudoalteromonas sp. MMG022]|uniref:glycoside hydrolase family 3 protein n=1 Tax=Pseudoalteromonas sp. MMG022 TaxID=2909978 RepID=UPI001F3E1891|nr:exo 1,3/1,4-beta-D-glucan glucohydrolase [Pseudoalteromonas sp. MMG022]MCF6434009.1 exo 1,3/1,4-beta-D-glucan glucohydrolase [Pseudoalteromonas sp. MMG022]
MKNTASFITLSIALLGVAGCLQNTDNQANASKQIWPKLPSVVPKDPAIEEKVAALVGSMTLEQKVAQMIQPEIRDVSVEDMRRYGFGSYLNGGGAFPNNDKHATPADWITLAEQMYQASMDDSLDGISIPTMWGTDAVHGHNNVIGATLFPHNIGLGAANNPKLIEQIAAITAREVMVTGIDWVFAPTVAVVRDDRWGRSYEGYSEDPEIVGKYAAAIVSGLQGRPGDEFLADNRVISTVKHFVGDGGTVGGDDQGNNIDSEQDLFKIHAQGYVQGLGAGAQSVMASFNSWHGEKIHGNKYLLTDVLKQQMGFDGFVVGDWNGHGQVAGCSNESCSQSINAGLDIFMVPTKAWKPLLENTIAQVKSGEISEARINDAVSRILRVKFRAGLFNKPSPANRALSGKTELIGHPEHRAVARQAVRESLVLLKNNRQLLPLSPNLNVLVAGDGADNIGKQSGGWTITWQGTGNQNEDFPGGSSIYDGIKQVVSQNGGNVQLSADGSYQAKPDVAIVVFGEDPYAEGNGDLDNLDYQRGDAKDLALLQKLRAQGIPVVSVFITGRPLWVNPELNASDAFVVAWLLGSEGNGVADVLFRKANGDINHDFKGKLSFSWPASPDDTQLNVNDSDYAPLFAYGYGLTYQDDVQLDKLSENASLQSTKQQSLAVMHGSVKSPWSLSLYADGKTLAMDSNTASLNSLNVRTTDRYIQEDSREITFKNRNVAKVQIGHAFPNDMRQYSELGSTLTFDIKLNSKLQASTKVGVNCDASCSQGIALTNLLSEEDLGVWKTVSIATNCFTQDTDNMAKVYSPFAIASRGPLSITLSNILFNNNSDETEPYTCDK